MHATRRPFSRFFYLGACLFVFVWGLNTHGKNSAAGDESHYLAVTRSLANDGDLDLANNYNPPNEPGPHARTAVNGRLESVHDIGLPILLVPAYLVASRVSAVAPISIVQRFRMTRPLLEYAIISLFMLALVCAGVAMLARGLTGVTTGVRAMAVAAAMGVSPPVLSHSSLLFPEEIAFVVACGMVWWMHQRAPRAWTTWTLAASLGLLPWFHRKFSLFVLAGVIALVGSRLSYWKTHRRSWWVGLASLVVLPQVAFHVWTIVTWGNIGGPQMLDGLPFSWAGTGRGLAGLLMDRQSGLVSYAPIYLPVIAWWMLAPRRSRWLLVPAASLLLPMSSYVVWWAGFSPAARYLVPIMPFFAVAAAESLEFAVVRWATAALMTLEMPLVLYAWQHPRLLWPTGDGNPLLNRLGPLGRLDQTFLPAVQLGDVRGIVRAALVIVALNVGLFYAARMVRSRRISRVEEG